MPKAPFPQIAFGKLPREYRKVSLIVIVDFAYWERNAQIANLLL